MDLVSCLTTLPMLPVFIFLAELIVVTVSTVRIIFVSRGRKYLAPLLGFFEVTIWLFAIGQIMQNLSDIGCYLAFAGGFTVGNFLGVIIEQKLAIGHLVVRLITPKNASLLIESFQRAGYGVTSMDGMGTAGPVQIVFTVVQRKELANVVALMKQFDARAFYSVDELQTAAQGVFPEVPTSALALSRAWRPRPPRLVRVGSREAR